MASTILALFSAPRAAVAQNYWRLSLGAENDGLRRIALTRLGVAAGSSLADRPRFLRGVSRLHDAGRGPHGLPGAPHRRLGDSAFGLRADYAERQRRRSAVAAVLSGGATKSLRSRR